MESITFQKIPLSLIDEPTDPARLSMEHDELGALADSIASEGLHQPIGVRGPGEDGRYEIAFGHRRYCAHKLLQRDAIDCKVYPPATDLDLMRVTENGMREQLTPIEEAREVAKFIGKGHSQSSVARLFRRSAAWVSSRLALLDLDEPLQQAVHRGELTGAVATALADVDHEEYRASLIAEATNTGATLPVVRTWVAHYHADKNRIVANHLTVQEIIQGRQAFKVYCACESCRAEVPYDETRTFRFCVSCAQAIAAELTAPPQAQRA